LYHLRCTFFNHPGTTRLKIWVDALCINQANNEERNHQIQLMRSIYAESQLVIVWLGVEAGGSGDAFNHMACLSTQYPTTRALIDNCKMTLTDDFLKAVFHLTAREYWKRLWIIQEVALGDVVLMCGPHYCAWDTLVLMERAIGRAYQICEGFSSRLKEQLKATKGSISDLNVIARLERCREAMREHGEMNIVWLMRMGQVAKVTDNRDRVYGLLGLMGEEMSLNIVPDYNLNVHATYAAFTESFVRSKQSLEILRLAGYSGQLPSWNTWVPSFNQRALTSPFDPPKSTSSASKDIPCVVDLRLDGALECRGIAFDTVDGVGVMHRREQSSWLSTNSGDTVPVQPRSDQNAYANTEGAATALWKTLTANRDVNGDEAPGSYAELLRPCLDRSHGSLVYISEFVSSNAIFKVFGKDLADYFNFEEDSTSEKSRLVSYEVANQARRCLTSRKLITTKGGYLALAPLRTQRGDVISILFGCSTPMVLRPFGSHYRLIGEAYVYGIMDGEGTEDYLSRRQRAELFRLY